MALPFAYRQAHRKYDYKESQQVRTLYLQIENDFIGSPVVIGDAAVVAGVFRLHSADDEAPVAEDAPPPINRYQAGRPVTASQEEKGTD